MSKKAEVASRVTQEYKDNIARNLNVSQFQMDVLDGKIRVAARFVGITYDEMWLRVRGAVSNHTMFSTLVQNLDMVNATKSLVDTVFFTAGIATSPAEGPNPRKGRL